ncbi:MULTISPECIES: hypothetical protein [unclassified Streptomyces]|uniref:hypothetical protein n=1 Tax=unclassified Streptomyces TaxID=2593676 RepID=UPI0019033F1D|nr:hypothetical protein [Streptomyces sp. HSG2]
MRNPPIEKLPTEPLRESDIGEVDSEAGLVVGTPAFAGVAATYVVSFAAGVGAGYGVMAL